MFQQVTRVILIAYKCWIILGIFKFLLREISCTKQTSKTGEVLLFSSRIVLP